MKSGEKFSFQHISHNQLIAKSAERQTWFQRGSTLVFFLKNRKFEKLLWILADLEEEAVQILQKSD